VITYLLLCGVLPFDSESEKEVARQTIQDEPEYNFSPWDKISSNAKHMCSKMMTKNRKHRPAIGEILNLPWFAEFKKRNKRDGSPDAGSSDNEFKAYTLTDPSNPAV